MFVCLFGVENAGGATTSQIISDEIRNEGAYTCIEESGIFRQGFVLDFVLRLREIVSLRSCIVGDLRSCFPISFWVISNHFDKKNTASELNETWYCRLGIVGARAHWEKSRELCACLRRCAY